MAALDYLRNHGLHAEPLPGERLYVWPSGRITDDIRIWIKSHKDELLTELSAANHPRFSLGARKRAWLVRIDLQRMTVVSPHARTKAEALASVSARWPNANVEAIEP
ncbi:hypothetical protein [Vreelandella zhaodongensis]|uniref:hypothetical protein n=1 Tax=Vreelandella zhaodongensis TaxID=1176240 RepID=UPI003EBB8E21